MGIEVGVCYIHGIGWCNRGWRCVRHTRTGAGYVTGSLDGHVGCNGQKAQEKQKARK